MLREILERDLCGNARAQGERLRAGFERLAKKYGVIGDIRGKGLLQGIEFVQGPEDEGAVPRRASASACSVGRRALANGLLCRFDPHWLAVRPAAGGDGGADRRDAGGAGPEHGRGAGDDPISLRLLCPGSVPVWNGLWNRGSLLNHLLPICCVGQSHNP